jgi:dipeptidyl aminopeptidase/acylaminoacyl peptidase
MTTGREWDLERICLSALECPPAERAAFLAEACGSDEELRREAESLIARDGSAASFLEMPPMPGALTAAFAVTAHTMAVGDCIGPYSIVSRLGSGGMGEVYRARDATLDREVAIKVLPSLFTSDPQRIERFEREARLLASVNHPNIATIHGVEHTGGIYALVLELVEGETLADRLRSTSARSKRGGGLPLADVVSIARQIADALEAAHEKGIVHRDLKPANVMIRRDGVVKLLDFGLAKGRIDDRHGAPPAVSSPVRGSTDAGAIAGTAAYMSPEQARGEPVDRRADLWAFGCVIYEMLADRRAFGGRTTSDVLAAVLEREPDFDALPAETPDGIRRLLRRALIKDPRNRLRDVADARLQLVQGYGDVAAWGAGFGTPQSAAARRASDADMRTRRGIRILLPLGIGVSALAIGLTLYRTVDRQSPDAPKIVSRLELVPRESAPLLAGATSGMVGVGNIAISSDGAPTRIAYVTNGGVAVRSLDQLDTRVIKAGRGLTAHLFFSRDGRWIGYIDDGLRKMSVDGGPSILLARVGAGATATWGEEAIIVADVNGLFKVSPDGGTPERIPGATFASHEQPAFPEILPQDSAVLFTVIATRTISPSSAATAPGSRIEAIDLRTGARKVVVRGGGRPRYISAGHLVYGSGEAINAVSFDAARLEARGDPAHVADGGASSFGVSREGTLVYRSDDGAKHRTLVWVDRNGREEDLGAPPGDYILPRVSPDGLRVALDVGGPDRNIWVWDIRRKLLEIVTLNRAEDGWPRWSPDGRWLFFASTRDGPVPNIYRQPADRSGSPERVLVSDRLQHPTGFAPDGTLIIGERAPDNGQNDIVAYSFDTRRVEPVISTEIDEGDGAVSPDGRWISYGSGESGQMEVYVRPYPKTDGGQWKVSRNGGRQAAWSRDGRELFYRDYGGALIAVPVPPGPRFLPGAQRTILPAQTTYAGSGAAITSRTYDVSPDGARFLMVRIANANRPSSLIVVQNWSEELKVRVPVR